MTPLAAAFIAAVRAVALASIVWSLALALHLALRRRK